MMGKESKCDSWTFFARDLHTPYGSGGQSFGVEDHIRFLNVPVRVISQINQNKFM